jgi:hypothetical protein
MREASTVLIALSKIVVVPKDCTMKAYRDMEVEFHAF